MASFSCNGPTSSLASTLVPYSAWFPQFLSGTEEWANDEMKARTTDPCPLTSQVSYFSRYCQVCRRSLLCGKPLNICSGCKRVYYCSKEHQREDWKEHKVLCKLCPPVNDTPLADWKEWRAKLMNDFNSIQGRAALTGKPLTGDNFARYQHKYLNQPHCTSCFIQSELITCGKCHVVMHCDAAKCRQKFKDTHTTESCQNHAIRIAAVVMAI